MLIFITNVVAIAYHVDIYYKSGWYYKSCCSLLELRVIHTTYIMTSETFIKIAITATPCLQDKVYDPAKNPRLVQHLLF